MILSNFSLNKNYAAEFVAFNKIRNFSDGLSIFELTLNWDRYKGDHSPRLEFFFLLFNFAIIECNIYYKFHRENNEN